jgi:hypothetical protein
LFEIIRVTTIFACSETDFLSVKIIPSTGSETANYPELAATMRGLLEIRADLQRLTTDTLAQFADAARRVVEARKRRAALRTFGMHRAKMNDLFDEFDNAIADAMRTRAAFIRTELELGFTFLDGAMKAREPHARQRGIRNAIAALSAANRFLAAKPRLSDSGSAEIYQRRNELQQRLHDIFAEHQTADA